MQLAMMEATNWDGVFVADFAAERARLGKANVMRLARRPAADDAGLGCYIFAVLLVAQANGLDRNTATARAGGPGREDRGSGGVVDRGGERFFNRRIGFFLQRRLRFFRETSGCGVDRCELFAEAGFDEVGIGGDQCVLDRKVLVNPVRRLVRRLKPIEVGDQLVTERRRFLGAQAGFCRTGRGILADVARSDSRPFVRRDSQRWLKCRGRPFPRTRRTACLRCC